MKKLLFIPIAVLAISVSSCGKVCVRCENGISAETQTKCFTDDGERDEYVFTREIQGFTCNDD